MTRHQISDPKNQFEKQLEKQLIAMLLEEIRQTQKLHEMLEQESEALVARDIASLKKITSNKLEQIHLLESTGQQRDAMLASIKGEPLTDNKQLSPHWRELLSLATKCQEKNRINGGIIEVGFRQSQQALDILQGTSSKPELYDNSGQTTKSKNSGSIAQA